MSKIYLTPNLYLFNNKSYYEYEYESDNSDDFLVTKCKTNNKNWHNHYNDYGYCKLDLGWRKRLKSNKSNNSLWGCLDCGAGGDCLFLVIEEGFKDFSRPDEEYFSVENLRFLVSNEIDKNNFPLIIETYKLEKENDEFNGFWDPDEIENIEDLKEKIREKGNSFWGDHIIIQLLEKALNINIIIMNSENDYYENKQFSIQSTGTEFIKDRRTIIIYYCLNCHFQLIGYFNGNRIQTLFSYEELPDEIKNVYFLDTGISI